MWRALSVTFWLSSTVAIAAGTEPSEPPAAGTSTGNRAIWTEPLPLLLTPLGYTGIVVGANLPASSGWSPWGRTIRRCSATT